MNLIALLAGTLIIVLFSWFYSIRHGRYHGIPRFFSFESIFILVLLNYKVWFRDPLAPLQIISWILLIMSAYTGIAGIVLLKKVGKPGKNFENTSVLVKSGLYRFIRHPLYCSLLLLGTGVMFKDAGAAQLLLGIINLAAIFFTARLEEKEMVAKFGDAYTDYMKETKMFVPFVV